MIKKIDPVILGIIILTLAIFGGILFSAQKVSSSQLKEYKKTDPQKPKIELSERFFYLGQVSATEAKTREISLKNVGDEPLGIRNFSTSCMCTSVKVKTENGTSPSFSMHDNPSWFTEIAPGKEAILEITYDPKLHPAKGKISRTVYFNTNDPEAPSVEINFEAEVK